MRQLSTSTTLMFLLCLWLPTTQLTGAEMPSEEQDLVWQRYHQQMLTMPAKPLAELQDIRNAQLADGSWPDCDSVNCWPWIRPAAEPDGAADWEACPAM